MFVSSFLLATLSSVPAPESAEIVPADVGSAVHPGRGPHRHPKRKPGPKPGPDRKKRFQRLHHGGQFGVSTTVNLGTFYGLDEPLYTLDLQSEVRTSPRSSTAVSLGFAGMGELALVELGAQGRFYISGNFETGFFGGAGLTASFVEEGLYWLRVGPVAGYKQILPRGMTVEFSVSSGFMPHDDTPLFLSGGQVGLGGSM
jgi:hypothetical protein